MSYGVTTEGFVLKPLEVIKQELQEKYRTIYGANLELDEREPAGQQVGILSDLAASFWEVAEDVYHSGTTDGATGASLDNVAGFTGTVRRVATSSTVLVRCFAPEGTSIPAGKIFRTADTGARFETTESATVGAGQTSVEVPCEAIETGPVIALAGTITVIETNIPGVTAVTNDEDAEPGEDLESDEDLRLRRESEVQAVGGAAVEAVRAKVAQVEGVESVTVFENYTATTNGDGMPPKSIEVLVHGGDDEEIAEAIRLSKAGGIEAYGTTLVEVEDSEGTVHEIGLTRPTLLSIYCDIELEVDARFYPADGDQLVEDAVLAWADASLASGRDVVASAVEARCFQAVPGVLNAVAFIGTSASPVTRNTVAVGSRQRANFDSTRTTVDSTSVTP